MCTPLIKRIQPASSPKLTLPCELLTGRRPFEGMRLEAIKVEVQGGGRPDASLLPSKAAGAPQVSVTSQVQGPTATLTRQAAGTPQVGSGSFIQPSFNPHPKPSSNTTLIEPYPAVVR